MVKIVKVPTDAVHWFQLKPACEPGAQAETFKAAAASGAPFCDE